MKFFLREREGAAGVLLAISLCTTASAFHALPSRYTRRSARAVVAPPVPGVAERFPSAAERIPGCGYVGLAAAAEGGGEGEGEGEDAERASPTEPDSRRFTMAVLGDLHLEIDNMDCHNEGRDHVVSALENEAFLLETENAHVVSLGDLGAWGQAGTTKCFINAKEYLDGFETPYSLITGNHDLEGMDEFENDEDNLQAWRDVFKGHHGVGKGKGPQFCVEVAHKTLCVGLATTRFRSAPFSSHEVFIDDAQVDWFKDLLEKHPDSEGWRVLVFTHAPPMGSGLRVLQSVHIKNGCAWLNHSSGEARYRVFSELAAKHKCIKGWFSGHFHLSHDYEDSIMSGRQGDCTFVQVGVMGETSSRDGRRHTRIVSGTEEELKIYTISHHNEGEVRLDLTIRYDDPTHPFEAHGHEDYDHSKWFSAYVPKEQDGCYLESADGLVAAGPHEERRQCWWHMSDERVLGVHDGMVVEYDSETLSPLGVVVDKDGLRDREVVVQEGGRALMLVPWKEGSDPEDVEVVHPRADGSYWKHFQRNKLQRTKEKDRETAALEWLKKSRSP